MANPILEIEMSCNKAVIWATQALTAAGLEVIQTFDLHTVRESNAKLICPIHLSADCDCQLVVLLVISPGVPPASLIVRGSEGHSQLSLVDNANQKTAPVLEYSILQALNGT